MRVEPGVILAGNDSTWKAVIAAGIAAVATVVAADAVLHAFAAPVLLREIEDATSDYHEEDPTILVIGSSHARTFHVLGEVLSETTGGAQRVLSVPVEWGKFDSYDWVLEHRLRPFIEELDESGNLKRRALSRVLIVTEWWDSADPEDGKPAFNLPARAWELPEFVTSLWNEGLNPYNRNYLQNRFRRLFWHSSLVGDRGHERILLGVQRMLKPPDPRDVQDRLVKRMLGWQKMVEDAYGDIESPTQMRAFDRMIDYFEERGLKVTVVLYPRMPGTISERAKETTFARFREIMEARGLARGFDVVDMTWDNPMKNEDFENDFDHMTRTGSLKFSRWALAGSLRFLVEEGRASRGGSPGPRGEAMP